MLKKNKERNRGIIGDFGLQAVCCQRRQTTVEAGFQCAGCGQWNAIAVDEFAGRHLSYVEDCQVCCKANLLRVEHDPASGEFLITAELE